MSSRRKLVVVGNGMVGHRFVDRVIEAGADAWQITVVCEEARAAYDRVNLSRLFEGREPGDLSLIDGGQYAAAGIDLLIGERAAAIDRAARVVRTAGGRELPYDRLVLATGSYPFVPPVEGRDAAGCFV